MSSDRIETADGRFFTVIQGDANLVTYRRSDGQPVWSSHGGVIGAPPSVSDGGGGGSTGHSGSGPVPVPPAPSSPSLPLTGRHTVIRVTTEQDGDFNPRMMSYWSNAYVDSGAAYVFAGHMDGAPRFFRVDLASGTVTPLGQLVPYRGTTEGWHWSTDGKLYLLDGPRLRRINPFDTTEDLVVIDISRTHPDCHVWQPHSSDDGWTLSATVQRYEGGKPGTVLVTPGGMEFFGANGQLDESQIDRSGRFLLIKEGDDNRIIDVHRQSEQLITNAAGALGHSDMGHGFAVGENDQIGACVYLDLANPFSSQRVLFSSWNMGYVSVRGDRCLHSGDTHLSLVDLGGSGSVTPLVEHGGTSDYDGRVKASLSPCGRVATYMAHGHVYLLVL